MFINLNHNNLLAKGSERACYVHPYDNKKVVKVLYNKKNKNNQNELDELYYNFLIEKRVSFSNIARYFGTIHTNFGLGLVFERVMNYDQSSIYSLRESFQNKYLSKEEEHYLLNDLNQYLLSNNILFADATSLNVLVKKISEKEKKLVIIDGLGPKRKGIKFYLYLKLSFYKKYKIKKQWRVFLENIKNIKKKIELNQEL